MNSPLAERGIHGRHPHPQQVHGELNAYVRLAQGDRTPFEVFEFLYGEGTAAKLHIAKVDPKEVVLKPRLVGVEMK